MMQSSQRSYQETEVNITLVGLKGHACGLCLVYLNPFVSSFQGLLIIVVIRIAQSYAKF